jgi:hypothetical protein
LSVSTSASNFRRCSSSLSSSSIFDSSPAPRVARRERTNSGFSRINLMSSTVQFKKRAWFGQADWVQWPGRMKLREKLSRLLRVPKLTRARILFALFVAVVADGVQLLLGPFGWAFGDQIIDVVTMLVTSWLIGFHWLLLPSFVLELVPLVDEFPTWTACAIAVIILRKRERRLNTAMPAEKPTLKSG